MKRPQGFDRAAGTAAPPSRGKPARHPEPPQAAPATEPIPIGSVLTGTAAPDRETGEPASTETGERASSERGTRRTPGVAAATRQRRRYERNEVRLFTRRSRRRRAIWLGGILTVAGVLGATVLVALSPLMALRTIDVTGTTRVDASAVRASLAGQLGTPLPLIDYGSLRRDLDRYPLIRSYSTEVQPPGTLVVHIVERTPIGLLHAGSRYDLVDQAGVVISSSTQKPGGYPVIDTTGAPGSSADAQFGIEVAVAAQSTRLYREEVELQAEVGTLLWLAFGDDDSHAERVGTCNALVEAVGRRDTGAARAAAERRVADATARLIDYKLGKEA